MLIQEIIANAQDLAGGELIRQKLDANFATLCALNVIDTMMLELANSDKGIRGYKLNLPVVEVPAVRSSGSWTVNSRGVEGETFTIGGTTVTLRLDGAEVSEAGSAGFEGLYTQRTFLAGVYNTFTILDNSHSLTITYENIEETLAQWWVDDQYNSGVFLVANNVYPWTITDPYNPFLGDSPGPTITRRVLSNVEARIGNTANETAANIASALNASSNEGISQANYSAVGNVITGVAETGGVAGNSITLTSSSSGALTRSGATFTGGVDMIPRSNTGTVVTSGFSLDAKFVRWRLASTDKWEVLDVVADIEDLTRHENRGEKAIYFAGSVSPATYYISWTPDEDITLEIWGNGISAEITDLNAVPPFPPEFSLLAAYRVADFTLNQLLIIDGRAYQAFVIAQKRSLAAENERLNFIWLTYRYAQSDIGSLTRVREYNVLEQMDESDDLDDEFIHVQ